MRLVIIYRPNSETSSATEAFIRDYKQRHNADNLEVVDMDSSEGIALASTYEIMSFPALIVLSTDGSMQKLWQGSEFPLMDEVASYANS